MVRQLWVWTQRCFFLLGCLALWMQGTAGQQKLPAPRPAKGGSSIHPATAHREDGAGSAAAGRVLRRGQQDLLLGYGHAAPAPRPAAAGTPFPAVSQPRGQSCGQCRTAARISEPSLPALRQVVLACAFSASYLLALIYGQLRNCD